MSLVGALNIGKTALAAHQTALQVTSNNIANAGNPDYTRQVARLVPGRDIPGAAGVLLGTGVYVDSITRQIDQALEQRIRNSLSDQQAATVRQEVLSRIESVLNGLGDNDLSAQLTAFFNSWSDLANKPQDVALRQVVLQRGAQLATSFQSLRRQLGEAATDAANRLGMLAGQANELAGRIATLNGQIAVAEAGGTHSASSLRDQRDAALKELAELMEINVQDTGNGMVNVMVGSEPIIVQDTSRGVVLSTIIQNGEPRTALTTVADQAVLQPGLGRIGALLGLAGEPGGVIAQLDALAGALIFELNNLHAGGQGLTGLSTATASNNVADPAAALNASAAGLAFAPRTGTLVVQVRQTSTGQITSTLLKIDLDGLGGDDTTLESFASQLDAIDGLTASAGGGRLRLAADSPDYQFTFAQDTSGVLAALGINSFFTGTSAQDIAVSSALRSNPGLLAAARNNQPADNTGALAIAALGSQALARLGNLSLAEGWQTLVNGVGISAAGAAQGSSAAQAVLETLSAQRESLSGVSLDEEAINLLREQRAYQAAARIITTIDELMRTLLNMV
jgi:flagellar hook-associated protein 1 FlgK